MSRSSPPSTAAGSASPASPFHAVSRRLVSAGVHDQLRAAILAGALQPGDTLPAERMLAEELGVNRHAVREALKRLQQARLVDVQHGGKTVVLDWRATAGLDVLPDLAGGDGRLPALEVLRSALEMRLAIGVDVARLCALRGPDDLPRELHAILTRAAEETDLEVLSQWYDGFWRALVAGSGNLAYRLADNSLLDALAGFRELANEMSAREIRDLPLQRRLVDAIAARDADAAARFAHELLARMPAEVDRWLS